MMCKDTKFNTKTTAVSLTVPHSESINLLHYCMGENTSKCVPPLLSFRNGYKLGVQSAVISLVGVIRVADKYRLIGCAIAKNLSTVLTAILCFLFDTDGFLMNNRNLTGDLYQIRFCLKRNEYDNIPIIYNNYNSDPNIWGMIAIVRDPLERFVSGFSDKCLRKQSWRNFTNHCQGCETNLTCFMERLYARMMRWTTKDEFERGSFDDNHFFPQNWRCDFRSYLNHYHIIKYASSKQSEFREDLIAILRKYNVSETSTRYIRTSLSSSRTRHTTKGTLEQQETRKAILTNHHHMDLLIKMFYYDFVLFGFPFPQLN
ncbi:hypothetical protein RB195_007944 [Necator americanus]|uniref:Sulfotransferase n=1 Tax=Necator americanus TaxID=51031 RepID=A0ABR1BZP0_NECAM